MANIPNWKVGDILSASKLNAMVDAINDLLAGQTGNNDVYITLNELNDILAQYSDIGHTHSVSEIVNLVLPTKLSQLQNDTSYVTEDYVTNAIANAQLGSDGEVDLSVYAKKTEIPTKTSQLQNDSNFISSIPSEYVTESELNSKGYLTEHQDINGLGSDLALSGQTLKLKNSNGDEIGTGVVLPKVPTDLTIDNNLLQLKDSNGNTIGTGVTVDISSSGTEYTLPTASNTVLGGIKVGEGLGIDSDGVLNVNGIGESISAFIETIPTNNLITEDNRITNFNDANGKLVTGSFTNYIKVTAGMVYVSNLKSTSYYVFDNNKKCLDVSIQMGDPVIMGINQDGYLLIKLTTETNPIVIEGTDLEGIKYTQTMLKTDKIQPLSKWYGKRWLCLGDSITTDRNAYARTGYAKLVSRDLGMILRNLAVSGKTMAYFYDIIDNLSDEYDLITIMLGTNNEGYNCALGSLNDDYYKNGEYDSGNSFYAQTQLLYEKLRLKYPKSVIIFITPIKRSAVGNNANNDDNGYHKNALGLTVKSYRDAIIDVCNWYSIPYIDLYNSIDPRTEFNRGLYFMSVDDGTHPNDLGHALFIAPIVKDGIEKSAPYFFNDWSIKEVYGNIFTNVSELEINEGENITFDVTLDKAPTNDQVINVISDNEYVTITPTSLIFNVDNYNVAQTVIVNTIIDADTNNDNAVITLSTSKGISKKLSVTIIDNGQSASIPCTGISLDKTSLSLQQNNTYQLLTTVTPEGCTDEIVWSASNGNCTVVDGLVTAITVGDCVITATCGAHSVNCNITVSEIKTDVNIVTSGLIANLDSFDASARTMNDSVGSYDLTGISEDVIISDNYLYVPSGSGNKSDALILPLSTKGALTFSFVVDVTDWSTVRQFISGKHGDTFYLWINNTQVNSHYRGIGLFDSSHYKTIVEDNPRFIDVVINQSGGTAELYINGELKASRTGLSMARPVSPDLYLNNNTGNASQGDFKLYSFKVYEKCLTKDEIVQNMNYEKNRLS